MAEQINKITDHEDAAKARLLYQYRLTDTDLKKIIGINAARTQSLENILFDVMIERALIPNTVGGTVLDAIGERSGVKRPAGLADDKYKALIIAKIGSYTSYGTHSDILLILQGLGATEVLAIDMYPAAMLINYDLAGIPLSFLSPTEVKSIIESATAPIELSVAGVPPNAFVFLGGNGSGFNDGIYSTGA